jgi:hypothetical protein
MKKKEKTFGRTTRGWKDNVETDLTETVCGLDSPGAGYRSVERFCEHVVDVWSPQKTVNCLLLSQWPSAPNGGLCYMELMKTYVPNNQLRTFHCQTNLIYHCLPLYTDFWIFTVPERKAYEANAWRQNYELLRRKRVWIFRYLEGLR